MGPRSPNKLDAPLRIGVDEVAVNNGQYLMHRAAGYVDCTSHTRNMLKTFEVFSPICMLLLSTLPQLRAGGIRSTI